MRPSLTMFDSAQIDAILAQAKRILAEIGVDVKGELLKQRLLANGLQMDSAGERLIFPADLVDWAIGQSPSSFKLYDRHGQLFTELGGGRVHFVPGSSALRVLDHRSNETRPASTADFIEFVRLADGLEHIAYLATAFSTHDIEPQVSDVWRLYLCLLNSPKPVVSGAFTEHGVPRMAEMMALFRHDKEDLGEHPMSIFTITPSGSFRYGEDSCQNLLDCLDWGIPIELVPVTLMGLIAPITLMEATAFHTADVLAGLTMIQCLKPGHPVLFGGAPAAFHMGDATSPMMAIEALRLDVGYAIVARNIGLPSQAYMALSDAKSLDAQAGAETFGSAMLAALAGISSVSGPGLLDFVRVFSLAKLVFDNEICGQVLHFVREQSSSGAHSAVELAHALLEDDHLLTHPHTLTRWPHELYLPGPVYDRKNRNTWRKSGSRDLQQRVLAELCERLCKYQPIETDSRINLEMQKIVRSGLVYMNEPPDVPKQMATRQRSKSVLRRPRPKSTE
ncbi:MAG: hypothetical protein GY759_11745 [Chloroflexi bacterium]|nr:hypothetical protein [Chloroflexota bacterium]